MRTCTTSKAPVRFLLVALSLGLSPEALAQAWPSDGPPDARVPVTMSPAQAAQQLQNMRDFLVVTQEISGALARDDFGAAEKAAKRLGYSAERETKARAMGGSVPAFFELAITFFKSGDAIAAAARSKDHKATLSALEKTLAHCNACHAGYRQVIGEQPK